MWNGCTISMKHWTQKRVAEVLGVSREAVKKWFTSNGTGTKASKPDARLSITSMPGSVYCATVAQYIRT